MIAVKNLHTGTIQICKLLGTFVIWTPSRHGLIFLRRRYYWVGIRIIFEHRVFVNLALSLHRCQEIGRHRTRSRRGLPQVRHFYILHILSRNIFLRDFNVIFHRSFKIRARNIAKLARSSTLRYDTVVSLIEEEIKMQQLFFMYWIILGRSLHYASLRYRTKNRLL